ncbi:MAG TPA: alanine--tRNA ligase, partial [Candidatus Saccharimonadia bacterium]|nr:alanine--tRNA ligase [Candidatus Saccharimonadia bacterium]
MTSAQIRQSFLDFFKEKKHTIVPSDNVGYQSRDGARIFTNAGMNQFVPIFLGERKADVDTWPGVLHKGLPTRAADTQKCIRAGGKHNDLDDVGLDTYHHTFFEMLGNWSFGDYFKKEAIDWAWELVIERWNFPPTRVFATIYHPDKTKAEPDPAERDEESWGYWAEKFRSVGLDPNIHIVNGNKKDNFWMMADTGPCGPCTEIHVDLTPGPRDLDEERQKAGALLVNGSSEDCIEIWNNVFIEFNANPDKTFTPLPAKHVDTGMGFERVASIIQGTKNLTDFESAKISNYETDVFRPIFDEIERLSGKKYGCTLPAPNAAGQVIPTTEQEKIDVAFRVIADHIRTLSFAIADGIQPDKTGRNYTLRSILRRAVRYGRSLGFHELFFYKLVEVLATHMGDVFPEIRQRKEQVKAVLKSEEELFNRTLDKGIALFEAEAATATEITGAFAFKLYDEQGFPLDLTQLLARERGLTVDEAGFRARMQEQKDRSTADSKGRKRVVAISELETKDPTKFIGYDKLSAPATVLEVVAMKDKTAVVLDNSVCYAEMGGQVGDSGVIVLNADTWPVSGTQKTGNTWLHFLDGEEAPAAGSKVIIEVDKDRRHAIERHHTVTHLLHWALHEVVSKEASQKGSFVGPDKLTFDFNNAPLTPQQVRDVEKLVNERIVENSHVSWQEVPYSEVKSRPDIMQAFGDKYGDTVRVVQIGGHARALDGYSMELCGGTHTRATGEIGLFRIVGEGAVAAGVRRIEAIAGLTAYEQALHDSLRIAALAQQVGTPIADLEKRIEGLLSQQKDLEKQLKALQQKQAAAAASELLSQAIIGKSGIPLIAAQVAGTGDELQGLAEALKGRFQGVVVLVGAAGDQVSLVASVSPEHTKAIQAGKIIQTIAPLVGGKGGGRPDFARGAGKDASQISAALAKVQE